MKKILLPLIAFAVCFGAASGASAMMLRPTIDADSLHADSTDSLHAGVPGDTAGHAGAGNATETPNEVVPDSSSPHAADPVPSNGGAESHGAPNAATTTPNARPNTQPSAPSTPSITPRAPVGDDGRPSIASMLSSGAGATVQLRADGSIGQAGEKEPAGPDYQRLARLLSRMGAREAARTVEQFPAEQAAHALTLMSDKQAAAVLQQLKPDKAASLLQVVLTMVPKDTTK